MIRHGGGRDDANRAGSKSVQTTSPPETRGPRHVAIIMDGNGRWAVERGRPRTFGHHRGAERVREIVQAAPDLGVEVMTLYAFSTENWRRPDYEVKVLMSLFRRYVVREVDELDSSGVRVRFIGQRERLPQDLQRLMAMMEDRTAGNTRLTLQVAISYGARTELTEAMRVLAGEAATGRLDPADIDEDAISGALDTAGVPDPDLVIRTSGEMRVSNFLLWQAAYAEYSFVEKCWPDFTPEDLAAEIARFGGRERRFGAVEAV
ncbi:MAG: isoprenyl transferase [Pseudomonadota bacterium]